LGLYKEDVHVFTFIKGTKKQTGHRHRARSANPQKARQRERTGIEFKAATLLAAMDTGKELRYLTESQTKACPCGTYPWNY
jgi:hypothetical protein